MKYFSNSLRNAKHVHIVGKEQQQAKPWYSTHGIKNVWNHCLEVIVEFYP